MRTIVAILVLGVAIATSSDAAFAESDRGGAGHDPVSPTRSGAVDEAANESLIILMGPDQPPPDWIQLRLDNMSR